MASTPEPQTAPPRPDPSADGAGTPLSRDKLAARIEHLRQGNAIVRQALQRMLATAREAILATVSEAPGRTKRDGEAAPTPRDVVEFLVANPTDDPMLPKRIRTAIARGDLANLADALRRSDDELIRVRHVGQLAIRALGEWVESKSAGRGLQLSREDVRLVLACGPDAATPSETGAHDPLTQAETLREALTAGDRLDETLRAFLERLPTRQQKILCERVFTTAPHTLEELSNCYGVSRERVRQIEAKALRQLDPGGDLRAAVDVRLRHIRQLESGLLTLPALVEHDSFFAGVDANPGLLLGFLTAVKTEHRVTDWPGVGWCAVPRGLERPDKVQMKLRRALAGDRGTRQGATRDAADVVREFVTGLGAVELLDAVAELCGLERRGEGGWRRPPTRRERILEILRREARPWHVDEVRRALQECHNIDVDGLRLRFDLDAMRTGDHTLVRSGRSTYVAATALAAWEPYLDLVREAVVPMLRAAPTALFSNDDLLARAIDEIDGWPPHMPAHALEFLLFRCDGVRFAGRWLWQAAGDDTSAPRGVVDIAAAILEEHGAPMRLRDAITELRRRRSTGQNPVFSFPVFADAGFLYLIERDIGIPEDAYRAWFDAVSDRLSAGADALSGPTLARMLRQHVVHDHGAEPRDLLAMLGRESRFVYNRQRRVLRFADHMRR